MKPKLPWLFRAVISFFTEPEHRRDLLSEMEKTYIALIECVGKAEGIKYLLRQIKAVAIPKVAFHIRIGLVVAGLEELLRKLFH